MKKVIYATLSGKKGKRTVKESEIKPSVPHFVYDWSRNIYVVDERNK